MAKKFKNVEILWQVKRAYNYIQAKQIVAI